MVPASNPILRSFKCSQELAPIQQVIKIAKKKVLETKIPGFTQKIDEQKRREAAQPQGSFLQRNWMYIAIAFVVVSMMGGQN